MYGKKAIWYGLVRVMYHYFSAVRVYISEETANNFPSSSETTDPVRVSAARWMNQTLTTARLLTTLWIGFDQNLDGSLVSLNDLRG